MQTENSPLAKTKPFLHLSFASGRTLLPQALQYGVLHLKRLFQNSWKAIIGRKWMNWDIPQHRHRKSPLLISHSAISSPRLIICT